MPAQDGSNSSRLSSSPKMTWVTLFPLHPPIEPVPREERHQRRPVADAEMGAGAADMGMQGRLADAERGGGVLGAAFHESGIVCA